MFSGVDIINRKLSSYIEGLTYDFIFLLCDDEVLSLHHNRLRDLFAFFSATSTKIKRIQGGEEAKTLSILEDVWHWLHEEGASRHSILINLGGGTITDLGGFAGATYMRGLRTINIPTSLLAMVDASVGGKTGVNFASVKNLVGAFHEPLDVFIDVCFLDTLPLDELYSGYAELIKTALLVGGELWTKVLRTEDPQFLQEDEWLELINLSVGYKADVVGKDFKELGLRKRLNLGHTIGHALESFSLKKDKKALLHGEAIAIGLVVELYISYKLFRKDEQKILLASLNSIMQELYRHYSYTCKSYDDLLAIMFSDKKNQNKKISIIALKGLGEVEEVFLDDLEIIKEALDFYREGFGR